MMRKNLLNNNYNKLTNINPQFNHLIKIKLFQIMINLNRYKMLQKNYLLK